MEQLELFLKFGVTENERLYVIGNGFDVHHEIESKYFHFRNWLQRKDNSRLIGLMDRFFSNRSDFWSEIEKALGEYDEESITEFCEPEADDDSKIEHPTQWQAGVEDSTDYIFGSAMDEFRAAFDEWVLSIDINGIETDLCLPETAKYLSFNYTETLEQAYKIPGQQVLHIHGCRTDISDSFVIGHGGSRGVNEPFEDESLLLPYQNAYSSVIRIMNGWTKDVEGIIKEKQPFFDGLNECKGVSVMGLSYNDIDMPYLQVIATMVRPDSKWLLYYYTEEDYKNALRAASLLGLSDYKILLFE